MTKSVEGYRFRYSCLFEPALLDLGFMKWSKNNTSVAKATANQSYDLTNSSDRYEFVDKVARHYTIGNILHGESRNIVEELAVYCDSERLETQETKKIGFCM